MHSSLPAPVLQVDANVIHKVDTSNPENLFSMWTVFARCRDSVAQGPRLENLGWRLWARETFCCEPGKSFEQYTGTTQPRDIPQSRDLVTDDLPQLSGSVDSVDDEAVDFTSESAPMDIVRPRIRRQDSCASSRSRGRERHITSEDLEKMVVSIMDPKASLDAPLPHIPSSPLQHEKPSLTPEISGSTTSESSINTSPESSENPSMASLHPSVSPVASLPRGPIVTKGFSPPRNLCRITSAAPGASTGNTIPGPNDAPAPRLVQSKKQGAKFEVGGSSGSGDDSFSDRSMEARRPAPLPKKAMFVIGRESSEAESSLKSALHPARQGSLLNSQKKTASFSKQVVTETISTSAISDDESDTDYIDESAIDDDEDSSDWEDSTEDNEKSSVEEKLNFKRVDSKANLTSRRSLITLMLERDVRRPNISSQSTSALPRARPTNNGPSLVASPNDSDDAPLTMKGRSRAPPMRPISEIPRPTIQNMHGVPTNIPQVALSPRTTRRNMLATELTESLRRQLLWERAQKSATANAVRRRQDRQQAQPSNNEGALKRRHTSHDVANLKQHVAVPYMDKQKSDAYATSWDQYFNNNLMDNHGVW